MNNNVTNHRGILTTACSMNPTKEWSSTNTCKHDWFQKGPHFITEGCGCRLETTAKIKVFYYARVYPKPRRESRLMVLTLAIWACRLFLVLAISEMRLVKATLPVLNWFHISVEVMLSSTSISSRSLCDTTRSLWECRMLSSVNFDHESGKLRLLSIKKKHNFFFF